jgi:hypothetical protein
VEDLAGGLPIKLPEQHDTASDFVISHSEETHQRHAALILAVANKPTLLGSAVVVDPSAIEIHHATRASGRDVE